VRGLSGLDYWYPQCHDQVLEVRVGVTGVFCTMGSFMAFFPVVASWGIVVAS
jgi:hypothetical protein